jgi:thiamine biosynthesis lipoprotein
MPANLASPPAVPGAAQAQTIRSYQANLMGTPWTLRLAEPIAGIRTDADGRRAADAAFTEVARLEALFSEWQPATPIAQINAQAGVAPVVVPQEVFDLIARAVQLGADSDGAFDVSWAALRGLWDFKTEPPRLPPRTEFERLRPLVDYRQIQLDAEARTVFLPKAGMALGLGGIAKGYAIDRATAKLRAAGYRDFIVDGGGDLYLAGTKAMGQFWEVGVRHPRAERLLAGLPATNMAVVSSGDYERFFDLGGVRYHHIIDPRTGAPAQASVAVTVVAPEATLADALATAAFVMGPERALSLVDKYPGVEIAVMGPDGRIVATPTLARRLGARWQNEPAPKSPASQAP